MRLRGRRLALVPKRKPGEVVVTLVIDTTAFHQASTRAAEALRAMVASVHRALYGEPHSVALRRRREALGGNGSDARNWPDMWMSVACSTWLCRAEPWSCPDSQDGARLECQCKCHKRSAVTTGHRGVPVGGMVAGVAAMAQAIEVEREWLALQALMPPDLYPDARAEVARREATGMSQQGAIRAVRLSVQMGHWPR